MGLVEGKLGVMVTDHGLMISLADMINLFAQMSQHMCPDDREKLDDLIAKVAMGAFAVASQALAHEEAMAMAADAKRGITS